jgi:hypothetical protein
MSRVKAGSLTSTRPSPPKAKVSPQKAARGSRAAVEASNDDDGDDDDDEYGDDFEDYGDDFEDAEDEGTPAPTRGSSGGPRRGDRDAEVAALRASVEQENREARLNKQAQAKKSSGQYHLG